MNRPKHQPVTAMTCFRNGRRAGRDVSARGLTLIELLVVLAILAILSAVAVVSTESVLGQGRHEATQRTLRAIEEAVLGPERLVRDDGTIASAGFVADVGRLPLAIDVDGELHPIELLENTQGLPEFSFKEATADQVGAVDADPEVLVPCGWRGPYVRLPVGGGLPADGWGNPLYLLDQEGGLVAAGEPVEAIGSLGSDEREGESPDNVYSKDLEVVFRSATPTAIDRTRCNIGITVWQRDAEGNLVPPEGDGEVVVRLFGAEEGGVRVVSHRIALSPPLASPPVVQFPGVAIGPHVARAYVEDGGVRVRKSPAMEIQISPQGPASFRLILPASGN